MSTIPESDLAAGGSVNVTPGVITVGGSGQVGVGLILSHNTRLPVGTVQTFSGDIEEEVSDFFGASDPLVNEAAIYATGFTGASQTPSQLLMAQFNQTAVSAYLRGGDISSLTLAQLQAIDGTLAVTIDGFNRSASVNLSSATSFSNAASIIATALNGVTLTEASVTGSIAAESVTITGSIAGYVMTVTATTGTIVTGAALSGTGVTSGTIVGGQLSGAPGGIGTYAVSASQIVASESITCTYGTLTVTEVASGTLAVGQILSGSGVTASTLLTQLGTGTGGTGTYYVNLTQTVESETITGSATTLAVTYDSVSGAFVVMSGITGLASTAAYATGDAATSLLLTSATGATLSQGAAPQTPVAFMNALIVINSAWANFMTHFDPDGGSGNTIKQQFAAWKNTQNNRFSYFCWDSDASPATQNPATNSLGQILKGNGDSGSLLIWETGAPTSDNGKCAFALGIAASINYQQTNGRATFAFRIQAGLTADVSDPTTGANLLANGYCFYGAYGVANSTSVRFENGQITGPFAWADSFETQIWLNTYFAQQLLALFQNSLSVPFTAAGITMIQQACAVVIQAGLAFGAFAPNTLTAAQIAEVNEDAGLNIANALQSQGYYLLITLPSQNVQAARGPWPIWFYYLDRNSVQSIDLSSVLVQ